MKGHILILGGARSGKTALGESLALQLGRRPAYLATAEAWDDEMQTRIFSHRQSRGDKFTTIEEPTELTQALETASVDHDVILVDCLTLWLTNMLGDERNVTEAIDDLVDALEAMANARVIIVSNEVGLGIVPDNALARAFRDLAGAAHQRLAAICDDVIFVAAGLPMVMKGKMPS